jgi:hypothetical protein
MNRSTIYWVLITFTLLTGVVYFYESRIAALSAANIELRQRLTYLEPPSPQIIWSQDLPTLPHSIDEVMKKGSRIKFRTLEINDKWNRPIYIHLWHSKAWNSGRFCYVPHLIESNRHRVFIYQGGGSYWFDISPSMGFTDDTAPVGIAFKVREEVAIIALEAKIKDIFKLGNQLQIVIEPVRKGYHIAAIPLRDYQDSLCQVVTPDGFEIEIPLSAYSSGSYQ